MEAAPAKPFQGRPWQTGLYVGMALFLVSETFLFGSLFWAYFWLGGRSPAWPPEGVDVGRLLASVNTALLVSSSVTVWRALRAVRRGDQRGLVLGLAATLVLGAAFLSITGWEWGHENFRPWDHAYGSIFFTLTGFHGAHVLIGLLLLAVLLLRALRRRFSPERHLAVEVGSLYWHFVDLVWVFVFTLFYLI